MDCVCGLYVLCCPCVPVCVLWFYLCRCRCLCLCLSLVQVSPVDSAVMFAVGALARLLLPQDSKRMPGVEGLTGDAAVVLDTLQAGGGLWALVGVRQRLVCTRTGSPHVSASGMSCVASCAVCAVCAGSPTSLYHSAVVLFPMLGWCGVVECR